MVRQPGDWVVSDLAARFNALHDQKQLRVPSVELISRLQRAPRGVVVIVCYEKATTGFSMTHHQGTGFFVESGLLVTAAHVLQDNGVELPFIYAMNERRKVLELCEVLAIDPHRDVAILRVASGNIDIERHRFLLGDVAEPASHITSVAYPDYVLGNAASLQQHQVIKRFVSSAVVKWQLNGALQGGASGAPLINDNMQVVGLVHRGTMAVGGIPEMVESSEITTLFAASGLSFK
jgi:S1-C subfamily serine protease